MLRFASPLLLVALGCSSSSTALSDLTEALHQARCDHLTRCGTSPDETICLALARLAPDLRVVPDVSVQGAIAAHKIRYDGHRASQCVAAIAAQSCEVTAHDVRVLASACVEMFTGTLAGGERCSIDAECASATCELPGDCPERACCVGSCRAAQAAGAAGAACAKDHDCDKGLVCGLSQTCLEPAGQDAPCDLDRDCQDGLACLGVAANVRGACKPLPALHEPCPYQRCGSENLRCDDATHTCVTLGVVGDACAKFSDCAFGLACETASHTCRVYPTLGMPCDSTCTGDAFCAIDDSGSGTCMPLLANGSPCNGNQQCVSAFCEDGPVFRSCIDPYVCF